MPRSLDGALDLVSRVAHIPHEAPNRFPMVFAALVAIPIADGANPDMKPLWQRSQENSNWYPLSVEWSV